MFNYLEIEDIIELNRAVLEATYEDDRILIVWHPHLGSINSFAHRGHPDIYSTALAYCIGIIVLHPFMDGNHRTSLGAGEIFLHNNGLEYSGLDIDRRELQKERFRMEVDDDLEREFFRISLIECRDDLEMELGSVMSSTYGSRIESWYRTRYDPVNALRNSI